MKLLMKDMKLLLHI